MSKIETTERPAEKRNVYLHYTVPTVQKYGKLLIHPRKFVITKLILVNVKLKDNYAFERVRSPI